MTETPKSDSGIVNWLKRPFERLSPRAKSVLGGVVSIAVLAVVIFGVAALSAPKSSHTPESGLNATTADDVLYEQALSAMRANDTTRAVSLLEQAVAANPGNNRAQSLLVAIRGSSTEDNSNDTVDTDTSSGDGSTDEDAGDSTQVDPDTSSDTNEPEVDDPAFDASTDDLVSLLPRSASGFVLGAKIAVGDDATVSGSPRDADTLASKAVWTVHYRGSKADAAAFIEDVSKTAYPKNQQTVTIDGASAYFGTDGTRFATVAYTRGRYVFEVTLTTLAGVPSALKAEAEKAAKAFPDTM